MKSIEEVKIKLEITKSFFNRPIIIYPFGELGKLVKQALNDIYEKMKFVAVIII